MIKSKEAVSFNKHQTKAKIKKSILFDFFIAGQKSMDEGGLSFDRFYIQYKKK